MWGKFVVSIQITIRKAKGIIILNTAYKFTRLTTYIIVVVQ